MAKLEDAYNYICNQERKYYGDMELFKMITVLHPEEIQEKFIDEHLNICYIPSGNYNKFNLTGIACISSYSIIPMLVD
jgi:predicted glycosyltransferase